MPVRDILPWRTLGRGIERPAPIRPDGDPGSPEALRAEIDQAYQRFWDMLPLPFAGRIGRMGAIGGMDLQPETDEAPSAGPFPIDIEETDSEVRVEAELPGFDDGDVVVSVGRDGMMLRAERHTDRRSRRDGMIVRERQSGRMDRFVPLPPGIDPDAAAATLSNGILTVTIPKTAEARARGKRIPVQTA